MLGIGKRRHEAGAAAVEFAIVLPLLVLLLFGIVEFGLLLYNQQVITNASREGARYGIVSRTPRYSDGEIEQVVRNYCQDRLVTFSGSTEQTVVNCSPAARNSFGTDLTVDVQYPYTFLVLSNLGFGQKDLRAATVMKME
jgi:Flp pilus assembly protein TadG